MPFFYLGIEELKTYMQRGPALLEVGMLGLGLFEEY